MEEYDMSEVWRVKLLELRYQRELMAMDNNFSKEELEDMDKMIDHVKKEYAKALAEKKKEENENGKSY